MSRFAGATVLVTGGTGTFGRAFVRHLLDQQVEKVIVLSRDELKQSEMMREPVYRDERVRFFIGDVRDKDRLKRAFHQVSVVIHAAALKQIDACTYNPAEAVKTNVVGTMNVIDAAIDCGVDRVLAISSDKACAATTLYGKTKAVVEGLVCGANVYSPNGTRFACARYGNVFGSRGSAAPFFKQIAQKGGVLPLTDHDATRFHMRIDQAVRFVQEAVEDMNGDGQIFIPKLPSYRVSDLIAAFGCTPRHIGLRPSEKLHEVMVAREESRNVVDVGPYYLLDGASSHENFEYSSGSNQDFLSVDQLREEIACLP